jgi:hypothetical protein
MKTLQNGLILFSALLLMLSCGAGNRSADDQKAETSHEREPFRILYVDSYHPEYLWTRSIMDGLFKSLGVARDQQGRLTEEAGILDLKVLHMDTKRNSSETFKIQAAGRVRDTIESWNPDIVICSDDNAAKYLIVPYYLDSEIPFVFCGINHDASEYGLPVSNVTGIVEIHNAVELVGHLKDYARGERIAFLAGNNLSSRKIGHSVQQQLGGGVTQVYVDSYDEWKNRYVELQEQTDILLIETIDYFPDWDGNLRALEWFVMENSRIVTGSWDTTLRTISLITLERSGEEQGEWAGETALRILRGELSVSDISVERSKRTSVHLNMMLARKLGILFPMDLIEIAHLANELDNVKKILYVNSYHKGYGWSDDIEKGLIKALSRSDLPIDLQMVRMDTKNNPEPDYIEARALELREEISRWGPDIVIGSDDNFVRYVLVPYYRDRAIPFVFCGVNWDASEYDLPFSNATGMVEVDPLKDNIEILSRLSRGDRVGLLGRDAYYVQKIVRFSELTTGIRFDRVALVDDFEQWKDAYLRMQREVDMLILTSPVGLGDFDERAALDFVYDNSEIPSAVTVDREIQFALVGVSKVAEEQGWWAGNTALEVLGGLPISDIPLAKNRETKRQLNMPLANRMGLIFPADLLDQAVIWNGDTK